MYRPSRAQVPPGETRSSPLNRACLERARFSQSCTQVSSWASSYKGASQTALGSAHALDLAGLRSADIGFWSAWDDEMLLGVGALKCLSPDHGELKSMHTA